MIYTELNEHSFAYELSSNEDNGFSYNGALALFNYLENYITDDDNLEFDQVALRCEYTEYDIEEYIKEYQDRYQDWLDDNYLKDSEENQKDYFNDDIAYSEHFATGEINCFIINNNYC